MSKGFFKAALIAALCLFTAGAQAGSAAKCSENAQGQVVCENETGNAFTDAIRRVNKSNKRSRTAAASSQKSQSSNGAAKVLTRKKVDGASIIKRRSTTLRASGGRLEVCSGISGSESCGRQAQAQ